MTRAASIEDMQEALDRLILPTRVQITRDDAKKEWRTVPALWNQLLRSAGWSGSNSGGGAFGSRPVISAGAVDLIIEIATAVSERAEEIGRTTWVKELVCTCTPYRACQGNTWRSVRHNTAVELRAIAADFVSERPDADVFSWWVEAIIKWERDIKTTLGLNPALPRNLRKTTCPNCMASMVQVKDGSGEAVRTSALTVAWTCPPGQQHNADTDWTVRAIECLHCGHAWFRGSDLEELVDQIIKDNLTRETMTGAA